MKKDYIKLNNNEEHLSLGNLFRIIKDLSKNRISALQSELFCGLFGVEDINDTTVNNYCVGIRSIGSEYKQIFLTKEKRYTNNKKEFVENIMSLLNIMEGFIYTEGTIEYIDNNESSNILARKLFNLAKNDKQVSLEFVNKLNDLIKNNKIYECLVEELVFIVLYKRQPINETGLKKEVLENVITDTSISSFDLEEYLSLKLREAVNFDTSMKKLAASGNAYANFELGLNEYHGYVEGYPRYDKAFEYFYQASLLDHASANYMIGYMLIKKFIGSGSNNDLKQGYEYLIKAKELGNISALNVLGNMYKEGMYPLKKDINKALELYQEAAKNDYSYAINNIAKIEEQNNNFDKAFELYLKSADGGESWACNKVAEIYREKNDYEKAFHYYNKALESNVHMRCPFAYYNLAKYYYYRGNGTIVLKRDLNKAIEYYDKASKSNILEASIDLLQLYVEEYYSTRNESYKNNINELILKIENHEDYNEGIKKRVETALNNIKKEKFIEFNL